MSSNLLVLNSDIISFFFDHLQTVTFANQNQILFMQPVQTQVMKAGSEGAGIILEPLEANKKSVIICAVNDNMTEKAGGNHWSTVIFSQPDNCFISIDSLGRRNWESAQMLIRNIKIGLRRPKARIIELRCQQQRNGIDCGLWVMAHARQAATHFLAHGSCMNMPVLPEESATRLRAEVRDLVLDLSHQQRSEGSGEPAVKKKREFLPLQDLHGSIVKSTKVTGKSPNAKLKAEVEASKRRIAQAPRINKDPRAFGIAPNLVLESLVMRVNKRMAPDAIEMGNTLTAAMFNAVHQKGTDSYIDSFQVTETLQTASFCVPNVLYFKINCPFGCNLKLLVPPQHPTCCADGLYAHFKSNHCLAFEYGFSGIDNYANSTTKRRRAEMNSQLVLQAPTEAHDDLRFISQQPLNVIKKIVADLKKMKM